MQGLRYNEKIDVYSFGIILWEIETREVPHQGRDQLRLQFDIIKGLRPEIRGGMDKRAVVMMQLCWDTNPDARPDFRDLVKERNVDDIDFVQAV